MWCVLVWGKLRTNNHFERIEISFVLYGKQFVFSN